MGQRPGERVHAGSPGLLRGWASGPRPPKNHRLLRGPREVCAEQGRPIQITVAVADPIRSRSPRRPRVDVSRAPRRSIDGRFRMQRRLSDRRIHSGQVAPTWAHNIAALASRNALPQSTVRSRARVCPRCPARISPARYAHVGARHRRPCESQCAAAIEAIQSTYLHPPAWSHCGQVPPPGVSITCGAQCQEVWNHQIKKKSKGDIGASKGAVSRPSKQLSSAATGWSQAGAAFSRDLSGSGRRSARSSRPSRRDHEPARFGSAPRR